MLKRKLRQLRQPPQLRALACGAAVLSMSAYGCSLVLDTDGLTGGGFVLPELDASFVVDASVPRAPEAGSVVVEDTGPGSAVCPGGDTLGTSTSCGTCGFDCNGGACTNGMCQPVTMAIAGQGRAIIVFSIYGLVWSSVTARNTDQPDACAPVTPTVLGLAANATLTLADGGTDDTSVFIVSSSGASAYYASALSDDPTGIYFQDTSPTAGIVKREVGFGNVKVAASVSGGVFGAAEPASGGVMVYFADSVGTPGPHEYGTGVAGVDSTTTLPLDPSAPAELHTPYETAALAADSVWAYYGTAAGVYRIKLGATCTGSRGDGGSTDAGGAGSGGGSGDGGSSCEGLLVAEPSTAPVTVVMVDTQHLFVGTGDGALTRYNLVDGTDPVLLSTAGPFYGLTQDVDASTASVTFGATVYASSARGPILALAKDGTSTTQLATSPFTPMGIAVDGATLYWVEDGTHDPTTHCALGNGRLMRVRH